MKYKYYTATIACRDNNTRTVTITTDASNSLTKELALIGCSVEMDSSEDIFEPVRASRGKLTIQCNDDDIDIADLLPASYLSHRIAISANGHIEFSGFISNESSSQPYPVQGESFDLQFVSHLAIAENIKFQPLTSISIQTLCTVESILNYCFHLLGMDGQFYHLPLLSTDESIRQYSDLRLPISAICGFVYDSKKFVYGDDDEDAKYTDTTVLDVLTQMAHLCLFTITEAYGDIYAVTPGAIKTVSYRIINTLPSELGTTPKEDLLILPTSFTYGFSTDSSVDYREAYRKAEITCETKKSEFPWAMSEYTFSNQTSPTSLPGLARSYGSESIDGLFKLTNGAEIIDYDNAAIGNKEKVIFIKAGTESRVSLDVGTFIRDDYQRKITIRITEDTYNPSTGVWGKRRATFGYEDFSMDGTYFTPSIEYLSDDTTIVKFTSRTENIDPPYDSSGPYLGKLEFTLAAPLDRHILVTMEGEMEYTGHYALIRNMEDVVFRSFNPNFGKEDYSISLPVCVTIGATSEALYNKLYLSLKYGDSANLSYFGKLLRRLKTHLFSPYHIFSLSNQFGGVPDFYWRKGSTNYLLTGYQRDYFADGGKEILNLTSISQ